MEPITATVIATVLLGFAQSVGGDFVKDVIKDPAKDFVLGKLTPKEKSNFRQRFIDAFFASFKEYQNFNLRTAKEQEIAEKIVATIKKVGYGNYEPQLLTIFKKCSNHDFKAFIENMAKQTAIKAKITTRIIATFPLENIVVQNQQLDKEIITKVLEEVLTQYHKTFLETLTTREGVQATLDGVLENRFLLQEILALLKDKSTQKFPHQLTNLPAINPKDVIGRAKDLEALVAKLKESHKVAVVKGIGGIGKTTLAKLYVHKHKNDYNHVVWVTQDATSVKSAFALHPTLSKRLGLKFTKDDDEYKRFSDICNALNQLEKPCLLIIDNATLALQEDNIQQLLPSLGTWKILATSRQKLSKFEIIPLEKLSDEKARELFLKFYEDYQPIEEKDLDDLLVEIDYHTLMIELLAKTLQESLEVETIADLMTYLQAHKLDDEVLEVIVDADHSKEEIKLYKHIVASFSLLGLEEDEKWLLQQLAVLPSEEIKAKFFLVNLLNLSKKEIRPTNNVLKGLVRKGWLQSSRSNQYQLHRLLQQVVRYQLPITFEKVEKLVVSLKDKLGSETVKLADKMVLLPFASQLLAHLKESNYTIGWLYIYLSDTYKTIGQLSLTINYYEKARTVFEEIEDTYSLGVTFERLGSIYQAQGRFDKALVFFEKYNEKCEELYASNPNNESLQVGLATSYSRLGLIYQAQGTFDKALVFFEKDLKLTEELYTINPNNESLKIGLAISYQNLGSIYQAQGRFDKALVFFEKYNEKCEELYASTPNNENLKYGLAISYSKLGLIYQAQGTFDKALVFFEKDLKLTEELYTINPNNESLKNGLAISYERLGEIYQAQGTFDKALEFFEKETDLFEELYVSNPNNESLKHGLAISYSKLGEIYQAQGRFDKALVFFEKRCQLGKELYASNPNNYNLYNGLAISYYKLAEVYSAMKQPQEALGFYQQSIPIWQNLYTQTKLPQFAGYVKYVEGRIASL